MRALTFHSPGDVRCESVPEPTIQEPTDVLVRVELTAICGSDLHVYRGQELGLDSGTVLGHEFVGEIVACGNEVVGLGPGTRVASPFSTCCGECFYCRSGLTSRCSTGHLFGWVEQGDGLQGAQAELVRVPQADATLLAVPKELSLVATLLLGDVLPTGWYCAERGGPLRGQTVAVLGAGPIGLMASFAAQELGAKGVFTLDSVTERLELASGYGATPLALDDDPASRLRDATDGRGVDVVLECVGSEAATRSAFELVRPGGTISAAGVHNEAHFAFSPGQAYDKNLTYRAGRCPARSYMQHLLARVQDEDFDPTRMVSHTLPLDEGGRGYELFEGKIDGCTKVVLAP